MRPVGFLVALLFVCLGVYLGGYLCLYCGLVDGINALKMTPVPTQQLVWAIVRVFPLAEIVFSICIWIAMAFGLFSSR